MFQKLVAAFKQHFASPLSSLPVSFSAPCTYIPPPPTDPWLTVPLGNWKADRNFLRAALRERHEGIHGTMLCVLVSHMRRKLHMRTYKLYHGGWEGGKTTIESLEDQTGWIKWELDHQERVRRYGMPSYMTPELRDLALRILGWRWEGAR